MSASDKEADVLVNVASILFEYTDGKSTLKARGRTVMDVLADLDQRHPGLKFRIVDEQDELRPHIKVFIDGKLVRNLGTALAKARELHILQALSGG